MIGCRRSAVRTKGRFTHFNELDSENDDDDCNDDRRNNNHHRKYYRDDPVTFGGCLFGGACVPTTIITVTAILIGLFFELRFNDAWSLYIW